MQTRNPLWQAREIRIHITMARIRRRKSTEMKGKYTNTYFVLG